MAHAQPLINATTASVTSPIVIDSQNYANIFLSADNLGSGEEVDIQVKVGNSYKTVTDLTGAAVKLTQTISIVELAGGPEYAVIKDATVGACAVFWTPGSRRV